MAKADSDTPLLSIRDLKKNYYSRSWLLRHEREVAALRGVSLELEQGNTLAIVGSSGAGKSTLARCIASLEEPTSGEIWFGGRRVEKAGEHGIQLVFQDPGASLNPRSSVAQALAEPLSLRHAETAAACVTCLEQVGLSGSLMDRLTGQLSGGQKARLALARALAAFDGYGEPCVLILDESLSSLDLSVQAQIINLLVDLQTQYDLTYIFIAHDLSLAGHMADEVAVMYEGKIVEHGTPQALFGAPQHAHTKFLVSAALALADFSPNRDA